MVGAETVYFAWNPCVVPHCSELRETSTLWKIGKTRFEDPEGRLEIADWTFLPMRHEIVYAIRGTKGLEKKIHEALDNLGWRYGFEYAGREHFCIPNDFNMVTFINQFINNRNVCIIQPSMKDEQDYWNPR